MRNSKLRFILTLTILLVFGFITTCLFSYFAAHNSIEEQITETTLPLSSDNIYSEIQRDLMRPIFISSLMAQDTFVRDWTLLGEIDEKEIIHYLDEIQQKYGTVSSFFISDKTKKYYHPKGLLKTVSQADPEDEWYFRVQKMNEDYEVNVDLDTADRQALTIFVNYRVYDYNGKFIGVTGVGLSVKAVGRMIEDYQSRYGRRVYFVDRQGKLTLYGSAYRGAESLRGISGLSKFATQILTSPGCSISYETGDQKIYLNSRIVPAFDWYLIVEQVEDHTGNPILQTLYTNLGVSLVVLIIVIIIANFTLGGYQCRLELMATTDSLTGVANRHVFDILFDQSLKLCIRNGSQFSVFLFDLDKFKQVNDTFGHLVGDQILKDVTKVVIKSLRGSDIICRWGGEEFMVILQDCELKEAVLVAEKVRLAIQEIDSVIHEGQLVTVTASFGVSQFNSESNKSDFIKGLDAALYRAKNCGRNCVEVEASCMS